LFGGGVGENSARVRKKILADMAWMGIELDSQRNRATSGATAAISTSNSRTDIRVVAVDEATLLAQAAMELRQASNA